MTADPSPDASTHGLAHHAQGIARYLSAMALGALLAGCITVPMIDPTAPPVPCPMVTRQLTLTVVEMQGAFRCRQSEECLFTLAVGSALFVASTVVSGSVVVVGNTLHWMERNGRCTNQVFTPPEAKAAPS